jgi:hypothetical protein
VAKEEAKLLIRFPENFHKNSKTPIGNKKESSNTAVGEISVFLPWLFVYRPEDHKEYQALEGGFV